MIRPRNAIRIATLAVLVVMPVSLSGCAVYIATDGCEVDGASHPVGTSFPAEDGCNTCTCTEGGEVLCTRTACVEGCNDAVGSHEVGATWKVDCNSCSCTAPGEIVCSHQACGVSCEWMGKTYPQGAEFPAGDGCNTCTCDAGGQVGCTLIACATCDYDGQTYKPGESFPATDGCNTCTCDASGNVGCTEIACPTCEYAGQTYKPGESFPATDGCNTCTCDASGNVGCTKIDCTCDPATEWWRHYVGNSPEECQVIDFACQANTKMFGNECGCGCEQDASCPQYFDCQPPNQCDLEKLKAQCPYSGFAF
ncbi:Hypothetical protein A7982_06396 [Minicystis rosea]|nr:Hypothetical protein A7982_06396 [Minicystis rosea]